MSGFKPAGRHRDKVLTPATVRALAKPGLHADGNGLYLKVEPNGAKRWVQRVTIASKRRDIGLGSIRLVTLAEARDLAIENLRAVRAGRDPIAERKQALAIQTFKQAAEKVHTIDAPSWRNEKHGDQWINSLRTYVFPVFGDKRITDVTPEDVHHALESIWHTKDETARRVKQRINRVFKWAMSQGWLTANPAEIAATGLLRQDRAKTQHHRALPYSAVPSALQTVRDSGASAATKLAFEFLILTATRSNETRSAVWGEFDLEGRVWTIPKERMKAKRPHRVPLTDRCVAILGEAKALYGGSHDPTAAAAAAGAALVFPSTKPDKPLSDNTLSKLMRDLKLDAVPHGFRSSFRVWAGEETNHPREVLEMALAHTIKDKAEAAYARGDLLDKRKKLMVDWEAHVLAVAVKEPVETEV